MHNRISLPTALVLAGVLALAGCSSGSEGSRSEIYGSLDALIADSRAVVEVEVEGRDSVEGSDGVSPYTAATAVVVAVFQPAELGQTAADGSMTVDPGSTIVVRQMGHPGMQNDTPYLELDGRYLLFLTPTGLRNASPNEFYVTGGVAGIYKAEGDGFIRLSRDEDDIPEMLTLNDLK